jgi:hypothetical protein
MTIGGLVVAFCFYIAFFIHASFIAQMSFVEWCVRCFVISIPITFSLVISHPKDFLLMAPALLVHLWLPLFVFGASGVKLLYPIFRAVEWAQWFLKRGSQHPLEAIGTVVAILVFAVTAIWQFLAAEP